jgi:hypothetical protein
MRLFEGRHLIRTEKIELRLENLWIENAFVTD